MIAMLVSLVAPLALRLLRGRVAPDRADTIVGSRLFGVAVLVGALALAAGAAWLVLKGHDAVVTARATAACQAAIELKALKATRAAELADAAVARRQLSDRTAALERIETANRQLATELETLRNASKLPAADVVVVPGDDPWLLKRAAARDARARPR